MELQLRGVVIDVLMITAKTVLCMKRSILIVDDDINSRRSTAKALSGEYKTYTASDGREALETLNRNKDIQIVLTDVMMPGMNGLELLERIHIKDKKTLVIIITGYSDIQAAVEAKHHGAHDFMTKPVDLKKLEYTIKNAVEKLEQKTA